MVGVEGYLLRDLVAIKIGQHSADRLDGGFHVLSSFHLPPLWMAAAIVGVQIRDYVFQIGSVRSNPRRRTQQALFFSSPKQKTH